MARILVVDDETNIRRMVQLTLQQSGHTVETAADGTEGLEKFFNQTVWDLVLLDQRMPGLEGLTVLGQMRYQQPDAKIIMVTAFGTIDLAVDAMKAGATDFLRKPFTTEMLRGAVDAALQEEAPANPKKNASGAAAQSGAPTFGMTTINGFRIEFQPGPGVKIGNGTGYSFMVRDPAGQSQQCTVVMSSVVEELVRAHLDRDELPGGSRFWQALCEEALANYLWQNAEFPLDSLLHIDDFTTGLRRFVDSVFAAA